MAELRCINCGAEYDANLTCRRAGAKYKLRGVIFRQCGDCDGRTAFELDRNIISFISSKDYPFAAPKNAPEDAKAKFEEAGLCYFAMALRATVVILRASVESALREKGVVKGSLDDKIREALKNDLIDQRVFAIAHGARLVGNESIHEAKTVDLVEVQALFGATAQIINKLYP